MAKKEKVIDLKAKAEKVTDEELKKLQDIVSGINSLQSEIGRLEAQKHVQILCLHHSKGQEHSCCHQS